MIHAAVSDKVDEAGVNFFYDDSKPGSEQLALVKGSSAGAKQSAKVRLTTLDHEIADTSFKVVFLKIDTEGHDGKVLMGARRLLGAGRIRFIQFEASKKSLHEKQPG